MAVSAHVYGLALESAFGGQINFTSDTIKVMLCTSSYTPNQDTHRYKSDITNEVSGTGYTATGATLASAAYSYNSGTHTLSLTGANVSWAASTISAQYAIVYDSTPATDATRPLICYINFGATVSTTAGTFSIVWDASGIATLAAA